MKVYFLSSIPCALTLNGAFFGVTDRFERFAELSLKDNVYALFSPENAQPSGCFLNENLRFSPPDGFELYLLPDGMALYARDFPPRDFTLKTLAQERKNNLLATLFLQGELHLSVEKGGNIALARVSREFACAQIRFIEDFICLTTPEKLALYTVDGECVFCENTREFRVENGVLTALLPLHDSLGREAECSYLLSPNGCERTKITLRQARTETGGTAREELARSLLPFAFFESVLLGLDYAQMLSPQLAEKANDIRAFLGDFVAVVPTKTANACGLVRKKGERLFDVVHFTVDVDEGKIVDIRG